jgi:hypothetical protein
LLVRASLGRRENVPAQIYVFGLCGEGHRAAEQGATGKRMNHTAARAPSYWARILGFGGLIPFVALALASWLAPVNLRAEVLRALMAYAATIASFVGALHWGAAMHRADPNATPLLIWGVVPSLVAWLALLAPSDKGVLVIATMLVVCFVVDRAVYPRLGLSAWLPMRLRLTAIAALSCFAAALSAVQFP